MPLTTPDKSVMHKIILGPKGEEVSSKFIYCGKWGLGTLCKNGRVRYEAQQVSGYK